VSTHQAFTDRLAKASTTFLDLISSYSSIDSTDLKEKLKRLIRQIGNRNELFFEVILLDRPSLEQWLMVSRFFERLELSEEELEIVFTSKESLKKSVRIGEFSITLHFYSSASLPVRVTGVVVPELKWIMHFGGNDINKDELNQIELKLTRDSSILCLVSEKKFSLEKANRMSVDLFIPLSEFQDKSLSVVLNHYHLEEAIATIHLHNQMNAMNNLTVVFNQLLKQDESELKSKKINVQYDINTVKVDEKINYRDRFQKLKMAFQKDLGEIERKTLENAAQLYRPIPNGLIDRIEKRIDQLSDFDKVTIGDKLKLKLPASFKESIIGTIKAEVEDLIRKDLFATSQLIDDHTLMIKDELLTLVSDGKVIEYRAFSDVAIRSALDDFSDFSQRYEMEIKKLGPMDFLRAATAPLMMVASLSSLFLLFNGTRLNQASLFENPYVRVVGILAVGASVFFFVRKVKKSEKHLYDSDLDKMRVSLKSDVRNSLKRLVDEWTRSYSSQIREESVRYLQDVESVFMDLSENHRENLLKSQRAAQRKAQSIEQEDRIFQNQMRNKENFDRAFSQIKIDITQLGEQSIRKLAL